MGEGEFVDMLEAVGLGVAWQDATVDGEDNDWLFILASREPGPSH